MSSAKSSAKPFKTKKNSQESTTMETGLYATGYNAFSPEHRMNEIQSDSEQFTVLSHHHDSYNPKQMLDGSGT
jgi:hypothetical protein